MTLTMVKASNVTKTIILFSSIEHPGSNHAHNYKEQRYPSPGVGGVSMRVDHVSKSPFYASFWWLTAWDWRPAVASNVRPVKYRIAGKFGGN